MSLLFPPIVIGGAPLTMDQPGSGGGGWNVETALIDESILSNNTTPILDNYLRFTGIAGKTYAFEINAFFSANGAQDVKFTIGGPAPFTSLIGANIRTDNTNTINVTGPNLYTPSPHTAEPTAIIVNTTLSEWSGPITVKGVVKFATGGAFGLKWCQGTAASGVNPTTRLAGSWLQWKQVD